MSDSQIVVETAFRIKEARKAAKLSMAKIAKCLGIANETYVSVERGRMAPRIDLLERIAQATGFQYTYLATGTGRKRAAKRL